MTAGKFNKAASKYGLMLSGKVVREGNSTFSGIKIECQVSPQARLLWDQLVEQQPNLQVVRNQ